MLRRVDRILLRVPQLESAVRYYRDVLGMKVLRREPHLASLSLDGGATELVLHDDSDLPYEQVYYRVDDVRELYRRRQELQLNFISPPVQVSKGYRATVKDPFGNVFSLLDRSTDSAAGTSIEDAKAPGMLFGGIEPRVATRREDLIAIYEKIGRTADDLPYTPQFESLYQAYAARHADPKPTRQEVWRHLLNLRKGGKLPKLGEAKSSPPPASEETRGWLKEQLAGDLGRRDRLPYTDRFDRLVDEFNRMQPRPLSPHLVWRLVATLAK